MGRVGQGQVPDSRTANSHRRDLVIKGATAPDRLEARGNKVKVKPSVKRICEKCRIIRRHGRVMVICTNPRHKQRQG